MLGFGAESIRGAGGESSATPLGITPEGRFSEPRAAVSQTHGVVVGVTYCGGERSTRSYSPRSRLGCIRRRFTQRRQISLGVAFSDSAPSSWPSVAGAFRSLDSPNHSAILPAGVVADGIL